MSCWFLPSNNANKLELYRMLSLVSPLPPPHPPGVTECQAGLPVLNGSLSPTLRVNLHFKSLTTPADKGMAVFLICEMLPIQAEEGSVPVNKCESDVGEPCTCIHADPALRTQNWLPAGGLCHRPCDTGSTPRPGASPQAHGYLWVRPAFLEGRHNTSGILLKTWISTGCVLEKTLER